MTSEIQKELEDNFKEMQKLLESQTLTVGDGQRYLERYYNTMRKMQDLEKSRDSVNSRLKSIEQRKDEVWGRRLEVALKSRDYWRDKYNELKKKNS